MQSKADNNYCLGGQKMFEPLILDVIEHLNVEQYWLFYGLKRTKFEKALAIKTITNRREIICCLIKNNELVLKAVFNSKVTLTLHEKLLPFIVNIPCLHSDKELLLTYDSFSLFLLRIKEHVFFSNLMKGNITIPAYNSNSNTS